MKAETSHLAIGIDLGGTQIKAALLDRESGEKRHSTSLPTDDGQWCGNEPLFAHRVREVIQDFQRISGVQAALPIGLCAPGLAHRSGRYIDWMPGRMHGLEKLDWSVFLEREVQVLNDAQAALLGEEWVGSAKGCQDVFMLTLGTGVGGAILSGGRLIKGGIGRGGHLGHVSVNAHGERDDFLTPGSLEAYLGNQSLQRRTEGRYENTHTLVAAAQSGDAEAQRVWDEMMRLLAVGIASLINVLDPERVILGGGISSGAGDALLQPLQRHLDAYEWRPGEHRVPLVLASAGEWAGAFGSVRMLNQAGL